jgi:hypothetical protein
MIDFDLAKLYQVETKRLKEQVNRNKERFPKDFMFLLTRDEHENLRSQIATSSWGGYKIFANGFYRTGSRHAFNGILNSSHNKPFV